MDNDNDWQGLTSDPGRDGPDKSMGLITNNITRNYEYMNKRAWVFKYLLAVACQICVKCHIKMLKNENVVINSNVLNNHDDNPKTATFCGCCDFETN